MGAPDSNPKVISFGLFQVDLQSGELRKRGLKIKLQDKPFQILAALLTRAGQVVSREELRQALWPTDTFVDFDRSLNTGLRKVRDALGDSADNPRFIETMPRRGYRFIAPMHGLPAASSASERLMLAVLPFQNLSAGDDHDYFVDGILSELICELGQISPKRLAVIARTSAMQYKGTTKSIQEIARELNVAWVLEGAIRRERAAVRITAQLVDAHGQTQRWSAAYDRGLSDTLAVQREVARRVGSALAAELLPEARSGESIDPTVLEAYLRGRFSWGQRTEEALRKAIGFFEQALKIDERFARAYSGVADCRALLVWFGTISPREAAQKAKGAAERALEIDDSLSEAHASLALVRYWYEWDWKGAEKEFQRAIELNPSYAAAHQWYAAYLNAVGRLEEAQVELRRARELDPLSLIIAMNAADPLYYGRKFDEAAEHLGALLRQESRFAPALFNLGRVHVQQKKYQEAIGSFEKVARYSGNPGARAALAHACARAGKTGEARGILKELIRQDGSGIAAPPLIAQIHLALGETEKTFEWLRKGIDERSPWMSFLKMDPVYDGIRPDARFQKLLKTIGLKG